MHKTTQFVLQIIEVGSLFFLNWKKYRGRHLERPEYDGEAQILSVELPFTAIPPRSTMIWSGSTGVWSYTWNKNICLKLFVFDRTVGKEKNY